MGACYCWLLLGACWPELREAALHAGRGREGGGREGGGEPADLELGVPLGREAVLEGVGANVAAGGRDPKLSVNGQLGPVPQVVPLVHQELEVVLMARHLVRGGRMGGQQV